MEEVLTIFKDYISSELTPEDLDNFFNDIALTDIQKTTGSSEWCMNFPLISDAISFMYSGQSNDEKSTINTNVINAHTEKFYITPLQMFVDILSKHNNIYTYIFKQRSMSLIVDLPNWVGVPKYFDQIFVWGLPYMNRTVKWKPTDKKMADIVMTLWANFAKTSNPTKSNVYVKWSTIMPPKYSVLLIDENFNTDYLSNNQRVMFWNNLYPKLLQFATECCNSTISSANYPITPTIFVYISMLYICIQI